MNGQLIEIRDRLRDGVEELGKLDRLLAEAKADIDAIVNSGQLPGDAQQKKYAAASLTLATQPARRNHILRALATIQSEARRALRTERTEWNRAVARKRAELFDGVCIALRPFFAGELSNLKREAKKLNLPALRAIERAAAHDSMRSEPTPSDTLNDLENFLAHVKRHTALIEGA